MNCGKKKSKKLKNKKQTYRISNHLYLSGFLIVWLLSACSTTKYLADGEKLFTGSSIKLSSEEKIDHRSALESELSRVLRPKPNETLAGLRIGLWARQRVENNKINLLTKWLNKKYGEEAITLSMLDTEQNVRILINRLENNGYFGAIIRSEIKTKNKKASAHYSIELPQAYRISSYEFRYNGNGDLRNRIAALSADKKSLLIKGDRLQLAKMKEEKERIASQLKNEGFYNFQADFLYFQADTGSTDSPKTAKLRLRIKSDTPQEALLRYKINEVKVLPNYALSSREDTAADTINLRGIDFIQSSLFFRPDRMQQYLMVRPGNYYNQRNERITSSRLASLNTYRFINIRYEELEEMRTDSIGHLNTTILLSPMKKLNLSAEVQTVSKSNNFLGPALILSYRNRNLIKGGELLTIRGKLAYERQLSGSEFTNLSSYELGLKTELSIPRLLSPLNMGERFRYAVPRTKMGLSYDFLNRVQLFRLNSFLATFGYEWNVNRFVTHTLNPLSINFIKVGQTSAEFEQILEANPFLRLSFQQQFIAGMTYSFQYSQLVDSERDSRIFFLFNIDLAGNSIGALQSVFGVAEENRKILGQTYAQFAKLDFDFRHYYNLGEESKLVSRLYAGWGQPYGNSTALPYVKQFFAGGPNSIRAFRIRALGPGSYLTQDVGSASNFFDQAGDIKLEANIEYRFPLISYLKGAIFTDAGNIWLQNENPALNGGHFTTNFTNEIAIGSGIGLRLDIEFFVLRLDIATPLRRPFDDGFAWQQSFNIGSQNWRQENLIWNFGIGYPF